MKSRGRREAKREVEGESGVLVLEMIRVLGVETKKERGDRDRVERRAREDGDDIDADSGIVCYASDSSVLFFSPPLCFVIKCFTSLMIFFILGHV